ncbi:hypothetical protein GKZ28_25550 [Clostridium chromiireducens]|uniref:Uncharacterized protein n=1 Tax=Clostridium chromiireducens TaxID=225345 RepID=A0A964RSL2_9CLOT|nr:hypothetical protein [Clostridium chromiireducens]MVX67021.1 hypothetical protein [Clostridium chromiireducens]
MTIIGMNFSTNSNGTKTTTLHVAEEFNAYYSNAEAGRGCVGKKVDSVYIGDYDCSVFKVGIEVEIYYDKAINTQKGTFQPIKHIEIVSK